MISVTQKVGKNHGITEKHALIFPGLSIHKNPYTCINIHNDYFDQRVCTGCLTEINFSF